MFTIYLIIELQISDIESQVILQLIIFDLFNL